MRRRASLTRGGRRARADDAEADALFAIDYAYGTVEEAEYAVLDAISARMAAEDRAMAT